MNDFLLNESGDLAIVAGDLVIGDATQQHQRDIILSEKGWWHHAPVLGVGLQGYLNETGTAPGLVSAIRQELERDGMTVNSISVRPDGINIDANYNG